MLKKSTLLFVSIFFLLFLGLSDYGYACHGGKPPHGDCEDNGGGKTKGTIVPTLAHWGGFITENDQRLCVAQQVAQNGDYGLYTCQVGAPKVRYELGVGKFTARKGDPELCKVFSKVDLTPDRLYNYGWIDNCGGGACTI